MVQDLVTIANRIMREVTEDIGDGTQPSSVGTFSDLHDHIDANEYGGLCAENSTIEVDQIVLIQEQVDCWLKAGRPEARMIGSREITAGMTVLDTYGRPAKVIEVETQEPKSCEWRGSKRKRRESERDGSATFEDHPDGSATIHHKLLVFAVTGRASDGSGRYGTGAYEDEGMFTVVTSGESRDDVATVHVATLDTGSFSFMAVGVTAQQATDALRAGWNSHRSQYCATYTWNDLAEGVAVRQMPMGVAFRDGEAIR